MAYTSILKLVQPVTGTEDGTWGDTVNNSLTQPLENSIAGTITVTHTDAASITLTNGDGSASNQARYMVINVTGTLTAARQVICPAASKLYIVVNNTTGGYAITFKTSAGSGISVANGKRAALYCDGTNVGYAFDQVTFQPTVTISGSMDNGSTDYSLTNTPAVKSNVTSTATVYYSAPTTEAASFTLATLRHFTAGSAVLGSGSSITNQYGFYAGSGVNTATNNYGFYGNLAATASVAITAISGTGSTATVEAAGHGLATGDKVFVNGSSVAGYNGGPYTVTVVDSGTYTFSSSETAAATGGRSTAAPAWNFYSSTAPSLFGGPVVISASTYMDGLRITQSGSGNALVVEDSTNPDVTPFVITASGNVGIGTSSPAAKLDVAGSAVLGSASTDTVMISGKLGFGSGPSVNTGIYYRSTASEITGSTSGYGIYMDVPFASDVTSIADAARFRANTAAAAYTVTTVSGLRIVDAIKGAGSTITNQHGLYISDQTQGTNNYGITSLVSSGSNKWNIYASGTAQNYFAGNLGIGVTSPTYRLTVYNDSSDTVTPIARFLQYNAAATDYASFQIEADAANNVVNLVSTGTSSGALAIVSGSTERFRVRADGGVGLGGDGAANVGFYNQKDISGAVTSYGNYLNAEVQSDVTTAAYGHRSLIGTAAASFTLPVLAGYYASQGTFGAGSTVTSQYGMYVSSNMTGATNNYAYYGGISSAATNYNLYMAGSAQNYLAGNLGIGTSSPVTPLHVSHSVSGANYALRLHNTSTTTGSRSGLSMQVSNGTGGGTLYVDSAVSGDSPYDLHLVASQGGASLVFGSGGQAEQARIDDSGNLGLGVTPYAWGSTFKAFDYNTIGSVAASSTSVQQLYNTYYDGTNYVYKTSSIASRYSMGSSGVHAWFNAPSGTAGTAISFTQAMTLDSSGNLLVGTTTSPSNTDTIAVPAGVYIGGTVAANLLDDYEEGTWTPVIADATSGGNTGTVTVNYAQYTKIGRQVTIAAALTNLNTTGMTAANTLYVRGMPFTSNSSQNTFGSMTSDTFTFAAGRTAASVQCGVSDSWVTFSTYGSGATDVAALVSYVTSGTTDISFTITYFT